METTINLNISDATDTEGEKQIASSIQKLVNSELDAALAARNIDGSIVAETKDTESPDTLGWLKYLWDCLGKSAMEVPAAHPGQGRMVELLQELQQLPKHHVRQLLGGSISQKELWVLSPANQYEGLEQWLWELNEGHFTGHQQVEGSESIALSYINFSAFLARLLAAGVVEATRLSALIRPSPFGSRKPSGDSAEQYTPYASAAAEWIIYAGDVLFEMCEKDTLIQIGKQKWTRTLWESWKVKFDAIAEIDQFSTHSRTLASLAANRMREIESTGITSNVVEKFGPASTKNDVGESE